jgi:hypothetical protein
MRQQQPKQKRTELREGYRPKGKVAIDPTPPKSGTAVVKKDPPKTEVGQRK